MTLVARTDPAVTDTTPTCPANMDAGVAAAFVGVLEGREAFLALRAEWDALFIRAAEPHQVFQSHVVLRHWMDHYLAKPGRALIVTARRQGRLIMVWPLLSRRRFSVETVGFMGGPVAQFGDILIERGPDREALIAAGWAALRARGVDLFEARKARADSVLVRFGLFARARETDRQEAPYARLAGRVGPDGGPGDSYSARERSNYRRRLRRLGERGEFSLEMVAPSREAAELALSAIAMKQTALRRHGIVAPTISDPRFATFFGALAADEAHGSPLRVAILRCAGEPIGIDLAFDCKGATFGHVLATHPDHERGGIGGLLVHHSFACARARGSATFDMLAPADPYKRDHSDGVTTVSDYMLPLTLKGSAATLLSPRRWRPLLKSAMRTLPPPVMRRLVGWANSGKN